MNWIKCGLVVWLCGPGLASGQAKAEAVRGAVERIGPFQALRVHGSPEEMGFAHGFLMATEIVQSLDRRVQVMKQHGWDDYDARQDAVLGMVRMPPRFAEECRAIVAGVRARLGDPVIIPTLGRAIRDADILLRNSEDLLRAFGCSGFVVWGERAGPWGVIAGRNFDFNYYFPEDVTTWYLLIREPAGRNAVMTVTVPGYLGAFTGVNELGVCAFMHDGSGRPKSGHREPTVPLALTLAAYLETCTVDGALRDAGAGIEPSVPYPFPYLVRVIAPRGPMPDPPPVRVLHIDMQGIGEEPVGATCSITTNHHLDAAFQPPAGTAAWSTDRYRKLVEYTAGPLTPAGAWQALADVSIAEGTLGTLHSVVVYPTQRRLDLAFAHWDGTLQRPTERSPESLTFDAIFGN